VTAAARAAARSFGWTGIALRPEPRGHIHDSYVVDSRSGSFLLQRLNRGLFAAPDVLARNLAAVRGAVGGTVVPTPVPAPDGAWTVETGGGTWRAFVLVPGGPAPVPPSPATARSAGALLGRFHRGVAALDPDAVVEVVPHFHDLGHRLAQLRAVVAKDPAGRVGSTGREIEEAEHGATLAAAVDELCRDLPRRVAHNDAKLDNVVVRGGRAVCLVDLDTVMPGPWFWDVGDLLRSAASTGPEDAAGPPPPSLDPTRYRLVLEGYRRSVAAVPLEVSERRALEVAGAAATYEQALRFLADWIGGDRYYRTGRPGHNLDRARAQLALLRAMPRPSWAR